MLDHLNVGKPLSKEEQSTIQGGGCWFIVISDEEVILAC